MERWLHKQGEVRNIGECIGAVERSGMPHHGFGMMRCCPCFVYREVYAVAVAPFEPPYANTVIRLCGKFLEHLGIIRPATCCKDDRFRVDLGFALFSSGIYAFYCSAFDNKASHRLFGTEFDPHCLCGGLEDAEHC